MYINLPSLLLQGNQPRSWNVITSAEVNNLQCICQESTAYPIDKWLFREGCISYELAQVQSHYPVERKFRNGSLGSKHFLAKFGYRHQRTEGDLHDGSVKDINVEQSINFVFEVYESDATTDKKVELEGNVCSICKLEFQTSDQLHNHLDTPGLPDVVTGAHKKKKMSSKEKNELHKTVLNNKDDEKQSPINIEDTNAAIIIEAAVSSKFNSKRIKWLCRQDGFPLSKFIKSKSQCEEAIRKGRVFVNRQVAFDSSRIVVENDVVSLVEEYGSSEDAHKTNNKSEHSSQVRFIKGISFRERDNITVEVVYKPVGIRCAGNFSTGTLEMITKRQHAESGHDMKNVSCLPVSKIDTGCAGLCVLAVSPSKIDTTALNSLKVLYTFTALVHGHPPDEWKKGVYTRVPTEGLRQWKRRKTNQQKESSTDIDTITTPLDLVESLFIKCQDTLQVEDQQLSTLTVQSRFDDGRLANVISYVLRKLKYPVVNDRFGKKEYSALPRRIKNIVKQKVCIGCYHLDIEYEGESTKVKIDPHKRTQCAFWREEFI